MHAVEPSMSEIIARDIADDIVSGALNAGGRIPSLRELSQRYDVSPSTATAGTKRLMQKGVLERHRGLGLFVTESARDTLRRERKDSFESEFLAPMLSEAQRLGLSLEHVRQLISERSSQ